MTGASSAKELLIKHNETQLKLFGINNEEELSLPVISDVPWVGASKRKDIYKKTISHPGREHHIKFITKNDHPHSFLWQTTPDKLKNAVRWGIIKTHSITSKVIASLGNYRVAAHERITKGMISNAQTAKLRLLDLFQDRFEALQDLESLVNKDNNLDTYKSTFQAYLKKLASIRNQLNQYFEDIPNRSGLDKETLQQLRKDLNEDMKRAKSYFHSLDNLNAANAARGPKSIMEFVKQQMIHGLYELQGINQDNTYSTHKRFALTRGELNDFIEDARKEIDDHKADARNAVTEKHHGLFSKNNGELLSYDFSEDQLTPKRETEILTAISFIEEWDSVDEVTLRVHNRFDSEPLDVIHAPKWTTHRNLLAQFKSFGFYLFNLFKSIILPTRAWEEESWSHKDFHLVSADLHKHTTPHEPMWQKPIKLFKQLGYALNDILHGVRDFGAKLIVKMPDDILNDWNSCQPVVPLNEVLRAADSELIDIANTEKTRLNEILTKTHTQISAPNVTQSTSRLATVEYALRAGEHNDILNAMTQGLNHFVSVFSHNIYAKDPVGGLLFTAGFALGAGAIYLPQATASIFGSTYVNTFTTFSYSIGTTKFAAMLAGSSTQAEIIAGAWDTLMHGPGSVAAKAIYQLGEDPLTAAACLASATALGYVLVNGIAGYPIPWLSAILQEDLGNSPQNSYTIIGAKAAILLYEGLLTHKNKPYPQPEFMPGQVEMARSIDLTDPIKQKIINRFILASWLAKNADNLPKLNPKCLFDLSRQIEVLFDKEQSDSLKKLLYPEDHPSIAFQIFSIPLSYIPAVLRLVTSCLLTVVALVTGKVVPFEPMKRAASSLYEKIAKDLSRLIVFTNNLAYLAYTGLCMIAKGSAYTVAMLIGRIAALFDTKPGHALHKTFAAIHIFFRNIGEWLYPAQLLKSVEVAHPTHSINEIEHSYSVLLEQMGDVKPRTAEVVSTAPVHSSGLFGMRETQNTSVVEGETHYLSTMS